MTSASRRTASVCCPRATTTACASGTWQTGKELKRLPVPGAICAAFSPDGKRIVTGGIRDHSTVHVWDTETGKELRKYAGHTAA